MTIFVPTKEVSFEHGKYFEPKERVTSLISAIIHRKSEQVQRFIDDEANIDAVTECGNTALHYACFMGYAEILQILMHAGGNINAVHNAGQTPLSIAMSKKIVFKR